MQIQLWPMCKGLPRFRHIHYRENWDVYYALWLRVTFYKKEGIWP